MTTQVNNQEIFDATLTVFFCGWADGLYRNEAEKLEAGKQSYVWEAASETLEGLEKLNDDEDLDLPGQLRDLFRNDAEVTSRQIAKEMCEDLTPELQEAIDTLFSNGKTSSEMCIAYAIENRSEWIDRCEKIVTDS